MTSPERLRPTHRKLKVGLVGLGRLGRIYAAQLAGAVPEVELAALADPSRDALRKARRFGPDLRCYTDALKLIDDPGVEAVVIVSPTDTHRFLTEAALGQGKPVLCEKPLSVTLADSLAVREAVSTSGTLFQLAFMRRFDRGYRAAKERLDSGALGNPVLFKSTSRDPQPPSLEFLNPSTSGGIFVDMAIHDFDLALWMVGPVEQVHSRGGVLSCPELESVGDLDNAVVSMRFESGALGVIDISRSGVYGYDIWTEIMGTQGTVRVGDLRETPIQFLSENHVSHDTFPSFPERFREAYRTQLSDFARNVLDGKSPSIGVDDGIQALTVALAAQESLETGLPVEIGRL